MKIENGPFVDDVLIKTSIYRGFSSQPCWMKPEGMQDPPKKDLFEIPENHASVAPVACDLPPSGTSREPPKKSNKRCNEKLKNPSVDTLWLCQNSYSML